MGRALPQLGALHNVGPTSAQSPHRFLLVDEDLNARRALAIGLRVCGHHAQEADTAATAMALVTQALVTQNTFDVVLVDCHLSDMNGIEFAQRLRRRFPGVRVVLTSAYDITPGQLGEHGFHPASLLRKPNRTEDLLALLVDASQP